MLAGPRGRAGGSASPATAEVTHVQGVSTARHPYRMMAAHHRSALRFTVRTTKGWRRAALPLAVVVLGLRMAMATARLALSRLAHAPGAGSLRRRHGGDRPVRGAQRVASARTTAPSGSSRG